MGCSLAHGRTGRSGRRVMRTLERNDRWDGNMPGTASSRMASCLRAGGGWGAGARPWRRQ